MASAPREQGAAADARSVYGELSILTEYAEPELRTGHDLLAPLTRTIQPYFDFKDRLQQSTGISYIVEYSPQYQYQKEAGSHANDETNLIAQWAVVDPERPKLGSLFAWYQISNTLGSQSTSEFMTAMGVISPVNGGDTGSRDSNSLWQMLAWEQWSRDEKLRVGVGKLTTRTFLNLNRYAVSDREDFFSPMLVNNPVSPFAARNGMGAFAQYFFNQYYLTGMIREADGTKRGVDFSTLGTGNWESAVELGLTPDKVRDWGPGNYRVTAYYTDSFGSEAGSSPSGWSVAFSFDQDFGDRYGALFRYAYASEPFRAFEQRAAAGVQIKNPFRYQHDRVGIGVWWGDPTAPELGSEYGMEAFWKLQLAPYLEVGPNLQIIFNPQLAADEDSLFIAGARVRLVL